VATRFLDDEARKAFKRAVEAVENATAVEVVIAIRRRSSGYLHANALLGAAAAFAALAYALYGEQTFSLLTILIDPFVLGALAFALTQLAPQLKRGLTPPARRRAHVARAAKAAFVDRGVHNTTGRTGLLVYVSWLEQQVALVADSGLGQALPEGALARAEATLTAEVSRGGAAVARAVEALADELGRAAPHRDDDVNELPDAIDTGDEATP
jgi:putative membrane protein